MGTELLKRYKRGRGERWWNEGGFTCRRRGSSRQAAKARGVGDDGKDECGRSTTDKSSGH